MKVKKTVAAVIVVIGMIVILVACKGGTDGGSTSTAPPADNQTADNQTAGNQNADTSKEKWGPYDRYDEPVTLNIAKSISTQNTNLPSGDTVEDNEYYRFIQKKLNVTVKHEWQTESSEAYDQKMGLAISSRDLPDAFVVDEKQLKQLVEADLIADLTEVYEKTASPLVKEYYESYGDRVLSRATFDGKLMAIPSTNIGGEFNLTWIRQDWLDNLGLQPPKTVDDLVAIAEAFVKNDPDGNGVADTIGITGVPSLAGYNLTHGFDPIFGAFNAYKGQWLKDESGGIQYSSTLPEMKTALGKLRDMYASGIIDKEFAIRKDTNELVAGNKVGIVFGPWWIPYAPLPDSVKNDPKAEWRVFQAPLDENGKYNVYGQNPTGRYLVVSKDYPNPEAVMKVFNVQIDGIRKRDPESKDLYAGLNVNWTIWPLSITVDYEDIVYRGYLQLKEAWEKKDPSILTDEELKAQYENVKKNEENPKKDIAAWADATARLEAPSALAPDNLNYVRSEFFGVTPTMEQKWAILTKMENETFLKIVLGEEPLDAFDRFVSEWSSLGGDKIIEEIEGMIQQ